MLHACGACKAVLKSCFFGSNLRIWTPSAAKIVLWRLRRHIRAFLRLRRKKWSKNDQKSTCFRQNRAFLSFLNLKKSFFGSKLRFWAPAAPKTVSGRLRRHFGAFWSKFDLICLKNDQFLAISGHFWALLGTFGHFWALLNLQKSFFGL